MSVHVGPNLPTAEERQKAAYAICMRARTYLRHCTIDWTPDPPTIVFGPDLTTAELALFGTIWTAAQTGDFTTTTPPSDAGALAAHAATPHAGSHPDLAAHQTLGLGLASDLTAHEQSPHGETHPDLAAHLALGLGVPTVTPAFVGLLGNGAATSFDVAHGLGTLAVQVELWEGGAQVLADVSVLTTGTVRIVTAPSVPATNALRVVIRGIADPTDVQFAWVGGIG